jgi:hypothetical protein
MNDKSEELLAEEAEAKKKKEAADKKKEAADKKKADAAAKKEEEAMTMEADVAPVDPTANVVSKRVRVYSAPTFDADVVGDLKRGDKVKIAAVSGVNVWVRIGPGQWCPFQAKGKQYLEMVD